MRDELLTLAKNVTLSSSVTQIGNILDFGAAYNTGGFDAVFIGYVSSAITGTGVKIQGSVDEAFTSPVVLIDKAFSTAEKAAGANFIIGELPKTGNFRYIRALNNSGTAGTLSVFAKTLKVQKATSVNGN